MIIIKNSMYTNLFHICLYERNKFVMDIVNPFNNIGDAISYCKSNNVKFQCERTLLSNQIKA